MARALDGHAWADDLGQAVDVEGLDVGCAFDVAAHGVCPGLGAEHAHAQGQGLEVHAQRSRPVDEVEKVGGGAADSGHAEILHHHDLPVGVAAGDGNHSRADALGAIVRAQPTGEESVAVCVLHDVAFVQAAGRQAAHHDRGPNIHVLLGVRDHDGLAGGPAGCVHAHHIAQRGREQAKGISVAQVSLAGERQARDIVERLDVSRGQLAALHALAKQFYAFRRVGHDGLHPIELQLAQKRHGHEIGRAGRMVAGRAGLSVLRGRGHGFLPMAKACRLVA